MISSLTGTVEHVGLSSVVLNVSGVGYAVSVTPETISTLRRGEEATLQTQLMVRDDAPVLYGFANMDEREVFETMMTVTGIGPRIALAVLSMFQPEEVRVAVDQQDDKAFSKVPGIGPKTARRIILELSGKLVPTGDDQSAQHKRAAADQPSWKGQVQDALIGLGWSAKEALKAIDTTVKHAPELADSDDVSTVLRTTLRHLGHGQARRGNL